MVPDLPIPRTRIGSQQTNGNHRGAGGHSLEEINASTLSKIFSYESRHFARTTRPNSSDFQDNIHCFAEMMLEIDCYDVSSNPNVPVSRCPPKSPRMACFHSLACGPESASSTNSCSSSVGRSSGEMSGSRLIVDDP